MADETEMDEMNQRAQAHQENVAAAVAAVTSDIEAKIADIGAAVGNLSSAVGVHASNIVQLPDEYGTKASALSDYLCHVRSECAALGNQVASARFAVNNLKVRI